MEKRTYKSVTIKRYILDKLRKTGVNVSKLFRDFIENASEEELNKFQSADHFAFRIDDKLLLKLAQANPKNLSGFLEHKAFEYLEKHRDEHYLSNEPYIPRVNLNEKERGL